MTETVTIEAVLTAKKMLEALGWVVAIGGGVTQEEENRFYESYNLSIWRYVNKEEIDMGGNR